MGSIPGYAVAESVYESETTLLVRARREEDGAPVVLKVLKDGPRATEEIPRYRHEHGILALFAGCPEIVQSLGMQSADGTCMLVLEDIGGEALDRWCRAEPGLGLEEALSICVLAARGLISVHAAGVIHKDINPSNIIYNHHTRRLNIIDFGISSRMAREGASPRVACALEGTLPYLSPEQTGRMNRMVDYRTDFYSFGATLYALLTARPPFEAASPMELVHCHIARSPTPPSEIRPDIPETLSALVLKLMAKSPEDRYQSGSGLLDDLQRCLDELRETGSIRDFALGSTDHAGKLLIPERLYGREQEIQKLQQGYQRVRQGARELLLISGHSGIGKTSLVQELYKPMAAEGGFFVTGKFEQLRRDTPYSAFVDSFRQLILQLLTESAERLDGWRRRLQAGLSPNARLLIDLIPELELVVGPQPELEHLPPNESRNRFQLVFQRFLEAITGPGAPLILFLDDLQWADPSSLQLIRFCLTAPDIQGLYLIGAFRDSEVGPGHPLEATLEALRAAGCRMEQIAVSPLGLEDVCALLTDCLQQDRDTVWPLAELLLDKTQGVPFFIHEFLTALSEDGALTLDPASRTWQWSLEGIRGRTISADVAELLVGRIQRLPEASQVVLRTAACIGSLFDLQTLAVVGDGRPAGIVDQLRPALDCGLVVPLDSLDRALAHPTDPAVQGRVRLRFAHDRILQAAYSTLSGRAREELHHRIGRRLLARRLDADRAPSIFDIVRHLNAARERLADPDQRDELAELNLLAGRRAAEAQAHAQALSLLATGRELLGPRGWERRHALMFELTAEAADAALMSDDLERMDGWCAEIEGHAGTALEKVRAYQTRIYGHISRHQEREALRVGVEILRALGVRCPGDPSTLQVLGLLVQTKARLRGRPPEALRALPTAKDPAALAAMRVLTSIGSPAYYHSANFYVTVVLKIFNLSLLAGNSPYSGAAYAAYGVLLCGALGDIEQGYRYGELALQVQDRFTENRLRGMTRFIVNTFIVPWKRPLGETIPALRAAHQVSLDSGDTVYAGHNAVNVCYHGLFAGTRLGELDEEHRRVAEQLPRFKYDAVSVTNAVYHQTVLNLLGAGSDPTALCGDAFDEARELPGLLAKRNLLNAFDVFNLKLMLACLFGRFEEAIACAERAEQYLDVTLGLVAQPMFYFFCALAHLRGARPRGARARRRVTGALRRLGRWARHAPSNFSDKLHLLQAERSRLARRPMEATRLYDRAIALARENGAVHVEALANELAWRFHQEEGREKLASLYLKDALGAYRRWEAHAKVRELEQGRGDLPDAAASSAVREARVTTTRRTLTDPVRTGHLAPSALDLESAMRAALCIAGETALPTLVQTLMTIMVENAAAERGFLLLEEEGKLLVSAGLSIQGEPVTTGIPVEQAQQLSSAMARFAFRTQQPLVLGDACADPRFRQESYVSTRKPRSVLCLPVSRQGRSLGVLYLENNRATDAFSPERVLLLQLLSAQAAISIDNVRLHTVAQEALARARQSARVKSEFLARTSHELRTPLNAIINIPEGIRSNYVTVPAVSCAACGSCFGFEGPPEESDLSACPFCAARGTLHRDERPSYNGDWAEIFGQLEIVINAGRQLQRVIDDILDISELEAGRKTLERETFPVQDLLDEVVAQLREESRQKQIRINWDSPRPGVTLHADREKIKQVLRNLIGNAIKFSPEQGVVSLGVEERADRLVVQVRDQGIGISPAHLRIIFDSFRQVDGGMTRKYGGTGLGLAITKNLIELHEGSIWVQSELARGSTFFVSLPRDSDSDAQTQPPDRGY